MNTGANISFSGPSATQAGDLLVSLVSSPGTNATWSTPAGFTKVYDPTSGADVAAFHGFTTNGGFWGYSTGTGTSNNKAFGSAVFRGAVIDVVGGGAVRSGTGFLNLPSVTLSKPGIIVAILSSGGSGTHSVPSGMTLAAETTLSSYPKISVLIEERPAGATGGRNVIIGGTPGNTAGLIFGITTP